MVADEAGLDIKDKLASTTVTKPIESKEQKGNFILLYYLFPINIYLFLISFLLRLSC